jgi:hypothetical protein
MDPGGIGGTGARADGGIGGTGSRAQDGIGGTGSKADGGIGGTGARAEGDVNLLGVITGFASICVNGVEVHYDAGTPVTHNGASAASNALALGQIVVVRATGGDAQAHAVSIHIVDAAMGPVTAIDARASVFHIMGRRVRLAPSAHAGPGLAVQPLRTVRVGDAVRVAGLRAADGTIVATRLDRAPPDAKPLLGTPAFPDLRAGRFIVQGYVTEARARNLSVGGMMFAIDPQLASRLSPNRLVRISGQVAQGGARVVERVEFLSSPLDPRPDGVLRRGASYPPDGAPASEESARGDGERSENERRDEPQRLERGADATTRPERSEQIDRPERVERPERIERPERVDRLDRIERPDRPEGSGQNNQR